MLQKKILRKKFKSSNATIPKTGRTNVLFGEKKNSKKMSLKKKILFIIMI